MTQQQYDQRRDALLSQLAGVESAASGDKSVKNRPIREVQIAIQALDADWERQQQGTGRVRIGRLYVSGEGK